MTETGLNRRRVLRAGSLTIGGQIASNALRLASNLLLTRLLAPEMFGIMALAMVVMVGIFMLSDLGLQQVVVRSPNGEKQDFLDTVWTVQALHGAGCGALLLAAGGVLALAQGAGWIAAGSTYARPELPWVLAGLSFQAFLWGLVSTKFHLAARRLQIGRIVVIEIGCQVISLGVVAGWAYLQPSVAALVAGNVSATLCRLLAGRFVTVGSRNRLRMEPAALQEIRRFGVWIFASSTLSFATANVDKVVLAAVLGPREFGLYAIALTLATALHDVVLQVSRRVAFPALSSAYQKDPSGIRSLYYRLRLPLDAFCLILAGLLGASGDLLIDILYDDRYAGAGEYLRILGVSLLGIRYALLGEVFQVLGRPRLLLFERLSRLLLLVAGILVGFQAFGVLGVVWAAALSIVVAPAAAVLIAQRKLGLLDWRRELLPLPFVFLGAALGLLARTLA